MKKSIILVVSLFIVIYFPLFSAAASAENKAKYQPKTKDKALEELKAQREKKEEQAEAITKAIKERTRKEKKERKDNRKNLVADMAGVYPPSSPDVFKQYFHFAPVAQYATSTCWSFSATSYFESEIYRLTNKKIKLSEMWTPYFELVEKCRRYITERGESYVAGGGETNSVTRIWKKYGVVPAEAYSGVLKKGDRHDHTFMMAEIRKYLKFIKEENLWDEENNLKHIRLIMDKYMGRPPEKVTFNGKTMTPKEFLKNETGLNLDDYYGFMSTKYFPFYTKDEFLAPDNWWHSKEYINLPLNEWYELIKKAIQSGYTMTIGGDVSEPGKMGINDVCFIPSFDIPGKYINQDSREYRIFNKTTQDDHGIHLVGYKRYKGQDWFLIKDSGRSARLGKHKGYYFFRGDFIKLKMLTFAVHKDVLKDILPKIKK